MANENKAPEHVEVYWGGEWVKPLSVHGWPVKKSDMRLGRLAVRVIDRRGKEILQALQFRPAAQAANESKMIKVKVIRAVKDPQCETRISIGGGGPLGYYCTFRGDVTACVYALEAALSALKNTSDDMPCEPDIRQIGHNKN